MGEWMPYNKNQIMWQLMKDPDKAFEIRAGKECPWDLQMRPVTKELMSGSGISTNWDEYLLQAIFAKGRAYIQYKDRFQIAYDPSNLLRLVPSFEIVGRYVPPKKKAKQKNIKTDQKSSGIYFYRFGDVLTADIAGLAMYLFGEINSYTIGQAYAWNNQNEYTPVALEGGEWDFDLKDFTAAGKHYNTKGRVQGAMFFHQKVGLLNGLKELKEHFPNATGKDIRALYYQYGMEPSSQISRFFPKGDATSQTRSHSKKVNVESLDLIPYIGRHHIKKSKKNVTIWSEELSSDVVAKNPFEIIQTIRANGDQIQANLGPKLWEEVTGKAWKTKEGSDS